MKDDYPAYDDYSKRYYNNDNYCRQNWSPIILFNEKRVKKSALDPNINFKRIGKNSREFLKKKANSARVRAAEKLINVISENYFSTKNTIKMVFIFICCGFCGYQTIDIFNKFASFPMDVNVVVKEMKLLQLPGITICNNNV